MKAVNILVIAVAVLALVALGLGLAALAVWPQQVLRLRELEGSLEAALALNGALRPVLGLLGALALAAAVGVVWGNISQRRWERIVVIHNPLGEVLVSLTALEDLGRLVKAEVPGVKDLKLRVLASRRGLRADARVTLAGDVDIPAVTEAVQASVRRRLQAVVGQEQDIRPRVMVGKVLQRDPGEPDELVLTRARLRRPPRP